MHDHKVDILNHNGIRLDYRRSNLVIYMAVTALNP